MIRTVELYGAPVDPDALICPGCFGPVVPLDDEGRWCHRDGSLLCWDLDGHVVDPVEIPAAGGYGRGGCSAQPSGSVG